MFELIWCPTGSECFNMPMSPTLNELGQVFHSCVIDAWVQFEEVLGVPVLGVPRPWRGGALSFDTVEFLFVAQVHGPKTAFLWVFADAQFAKAVSGKKFSDHLLSIYNQELKSRWGDSAPRISWKKDYELSELKTNWTAEKISQGLRFPIASTYGNADLGLCTFTAI